MKLPFTKMHGCGNDYVYIDGSAVDVPAGKKAELVRRLSDRHFGIGGDGVIFINPSAEADFEMEMYNADGSRAEMCGNGIRCVAKYVYDARLTERRELDIVSAGKNRHIVLQTEDGRAVSARVDMGRPELRAEKIPVTAAGERVIDEEITVNGTVYRMTCVSMGNPHAVVFTADVKNLPLAEIGPYFENHERFPQRINTEFVHVVDRRNVEMRVWERGTGETLACGTGCCAVVTACVLNGLTEREITVHVPGGDIVAAWDAADDTVYMTGPAKTVFTGEIDVNL